MVCHPGRSRLWAVFFVHDDACSMEKVKAERNKAENKTKDMGSAKTSAKSKHKSRPKQRTPEVEDDSESESFGLECPPDDGPVLAENVKKERSPLPEGPKPSNPQRDVLPRYCLYMKYYI